MIQANELRVGNYVSYGKFPNGFYHVRSVCQDRIHPIVLVEHKDNEIFSISIEDGLSMINPIPLTENILIKCGFKKYSHEPGYSIGSDEKDEKCDEYSLDKLSIVDWGNGFILSNSFSFDLRITIISLHQLQNIFFYLTGKELSIKLT